MDMFPTFSVIADVKVPNDRLIDGIDVSDFLLGKKEQSGREGFVVYMGNDVFGVKWRDWKIHMKEQDAWNAPLRTYTMHRVYNLMNDPQEKDNYTELTFDYKMIGESSNVTEFVGKHIQTWKNGKIIKEEYVSIS